MAPKSYKEFFEQYRGSLPYEPPSNEQINNRITAYWSDLQLQEIDSLRKALEAINYAKDQIFETRDNLIEARLDDLERSAPFNWFGIFLSTAVLPLFGAAMAGIASIAVRRIFRSRVLTAQVATQLGIDGVLTPQQAQILREAGKFDFKQIEFMDRGLRVTGVTMSKLSRVEIPQNQVIGKIISEFPGVMKNLSSEGGKEIARLATNSVQTTPKEKVAIRISDLVLERSSRLSDEIFDLERSHIKLNMLLNERLLSDDATTLRENLADQILNDIKLRDSFKEGQDAITREDQVRMLAQLPIAWLLWKSKIQVPTEISPPATSPARFFVDPGFKPTPIFIEERYLPERVLIRVREKQLKVLREMSSIFLDPESINPGVKPRSFLSRYPRDERVRHVKMIRHFKKILGI